MVAPGDADDDEEVLVDGDHRHRAAVARDAAQRVGDRLDVAEVVVGQVLHGPLTVRAEGREGEVDPVVVLDHPTSVTDPPLRDQPL